MAPALPAACTPRASAGHLTGLYALGKWAWSRERAVVPPKCNKRGTTGAIGI